MFSAFLLPFEPGHTLDDYHLLIPHLFDVFYSAIALLVIAIFMWKVVVPAFVKVLDERTEKIEGGLKAVGVARDEVAVERAQMEAQLQEARRAAAQVREDAAKTATAAAKKAQSDAEAEAQRILAAATRQINANKDTAQIELRDHVGALAVDLAGKILGESVANTELQSRVIDRFLDELESQNQSFVASNSNTVEGK